MKDVTANAAADKGSEPLHTLPVKMLKVADLVLHPQANRVPKMQDEKRKAFMDDVKQRGVQDAIIVQKPNVILDGRHRWEGAKARGDEQIPARVVDLDELGQLNILYDQAMLRRDQTDDQRAVVAAYWCEVQTKLSKQDRAQKGGKAKHSSANDADAKQKSKPDESSANGADAKQRTLRVDEKASGRYGVPLRKVRQAQKLVKEKQSLANQILAGELKLAQARRQLNGKAAKAKPKFTLSFPKPVDVEALAKRLVVLLGKKQTRDLQDALKGKRFGK